MMTDREVRPRRSSDEACEQSRETGRSGWSEGREPRETRASKARAGRRTGKACHRRWGACDKPHRYAACRQTLLVGAGCVMWRR